MGDVHIGDAHRVLDLLDDGAHLHAQLGVQVGQGLVHQQHIRLDHQGAGQCHALLLAAGQPVGRAVGILADVHQLHELVGLLLDGLLGFLTVLQTKGNVVPHGHVGEDGIVLEYHADVALGGVDVVDALVVEVEVAAFNAVEACDHTQKCRFSAAGGAEKGEELAFFDVQRQIRDDRIVAVFLHGVLDANTNTHNDRPYFLFFSGEMLTWSASWSTSPASRSAALPQQPDPRTPR